MILRGKNSLLPTLLLSNFSFINTTPKRGQLLMNSWRRIADIMQKILASLESGDRSHVKAFQEWIDACRKIAPLNSRAAVMLLAVATELANEADYRIVSKEWDNTPSSSDGVGPFP